MDFELGPDERRAWQKLVSPYFEKRGTKARVAEALARLDKSSEHSWRTRLSGFTKGETQRLRDVLGIPGRVKCMEKTLGVAPGTLRSLLDQARGLVVGTDPLFVRVPGFEDRGVIRADKSPLLPAPQSWQTLSNDVDPQLPWPQRIVQGLLSKPWDKPVLVTICGRPGTGRTALLRACAALLEDSGLSINFWPETSAPAKVLVVDDIDVDDRLIRAQENVRKAASPRLLLCTSQSIRTLGNDWTHSSYQLGAPTAHWAMKAVGLLFELIRSHWDMNVDLEPLREWLARDPLAMLWVDGPAALGHLGRFISTPGRSFPPPAPLLVKDALSRLYHSLTIAGHAESAIVIQALGTAILPALARTIALSPNAAPSHNECSRALVRVARGISGPDEDFWERRSFPGMLKVITDLHAMRFLVKSGDGYRFASSLLMQAALAEVLLPRNDGKIDRELLEAIVGANDWHLAVVAAATTHGVDGLIKELLALPPARLCRTPLFLAYLLALAEPTSGDSSRALRHAVELVLWWYSRMPTISTPQNLVEEERAPAELRPLSRSIWPYVLVAVGLARHHSSLPNRLSEGIESDAHPEPLVRYATLLPTEDDPVVVAHRLTGLAPLQRVEIVEKQFWSFLEDHRALNSRSFKLALSTRMITHDLTPTTPNFLIWWNTAAAPALLHHPEGWRTLLSGEAPKVLPYALETQAASGPWIEALDRAWREDRELARTAWRLILERLLWNAPKHHLAGLKTGWKNLEEPEHEHLREIAAAVLDEFLDKHQDVYDEDILRWLLSGVLDEDRRIRLWWHWAEAWSPPWRIFRESGLASSELVNAAVKRLEMYAERNESVLQQGDQWAFEVIDERIDQRHLASMSTIARLQWYRWHEPILESAVSGRPGTIAARLRRNLLQIPWWRRLLLRRLEDTDQFRTIDWSALLRAEAELSVSELVVYALCYSLTQPSPLTRLIEAALDYVVALLDASSLRNEQLARARKEWLAQLPPESGSSGPEEIQAPDFLAALAGALWWAHRSKIDVSGPLAQVMARPALCRQIGAGMQSPFWAMIYEYNGLETLLEQLDDPAIEKHLLGTRMLAVLRVRDFVKEALLRPRLRAGLAEVLFASPTPRLLAEDLDMICTALPLTMWDRDAARLLTVLIRQTGFPGLKRTEQLLAATRRDTQTKYWEFMIPELLDGPLRSRVLQLWFDASTGGSRL